jgi:glycosyltransferase involved in cell wall biosynthesis
MPADRVAAVLVATFRRPGTLARLLDELDLVVKAPPPGWRVEVVVCDNDPDGSARVVCEDRGAAPAYVHESRPGIAAARNALVDASAGAEVIVFIDDDEWPDAGWLDALVDAHLRFGADVVAGPVVSEFDAPPPASLVPAFQRARFATGAAIEWPGTGNVLIRRAALEDPPLRFRDAYGLSGGSDSMLFLELARRGGRMVWCDEAVVHETVPASRTTLRWVLRRSFRLGNTHTRFDRDLHGTRRVMALRFVKGVAWIATGVGVAGAGAVRLDGSGTVRGLQRIARGAGMLAALSGVRFVEYRRNGGGRG